MRMRNTQNEAVEQVLNLLRARYDASIELRDVTSRAVLMDALAFAVHHGIAPALAEGLRNAPRQGDDETTLQPFLEDVERRNLTRNDKLRSVATRVSARLAARDVPSVFLKGATFLFAPAGPAAWREMSDLDVLVRPEQVAIAADALTAEGYDLTADPSTYRERDHHHYAPLYNPGEDVTVELHVRLAKDPRRSIVRTEDMFAKARLVSPDEGPIHIPSVEHRMAHLIAHAQLNNWGYPLRRLVLRDVIEVVELSSATPPDWQEVEAHFRSIGARAEFASFLRAVSALLPAVGKLPEQAGLAYQGWTQEAVNALTVAQSPWVLASRIVAEYVRVFARNPARLGVALRATTDSSHRRRLISFNRARIGARD